MVCRLNLHKVGRGARFRCLVCHQDTPEQYVKTESMVGRLGSPTDGNYRRREA